MSDIESQDEAMIGRAARRSLAVVAIILIVVVAAVLLSHRGSRPENRASDFAIPVILSPKDEPPPAIHFTDITQQAGIHFVHQNGAEGEKLLPETMGGGVAFFDYDNDGKPDLIFVNGGNLPGHEKQSNASSNIGLYHNDGNGHFTEVTAGSGLDAPSLYGMGVAVGDYDNDGKVDVLITGVGGCRLFHNEGGSHFRDVTTEAGVGGSSDDWSTSAAFVDYDNDGRLDLFVCNYVRWSKELDLAANYTLTGVGRAYGPPMGFQGSFCKLYHNDGAGHFTDVSARAGIQVRNKDTGAPLGKALGVCPIDIDSDGYIDFIVANDTVENFLFHNRRDGTFEQIGAISGVGFDSEGRARGAMGIDAGYFRNDPSIGIAIGNFANEMLALYVSHPAPGCQILFTDDAIARGVGGGSRLPLKFGVMFFDYDLDGDLDLFVADGHIEQQINLVQSVEHYAQPSQLWWNGASRGKGFIAASPTQCGPDLFKPIVGRGCAYADIDGDGDLDIIVTQINGSPLLLRNDQKTTHHYLRLKLVGTTCNRDAIGAQVIAHVGSRIIRRVVMPTRGYLSQSELPITIGLGNSDHADRLELIWPGGKTQVIEHPKLDGLTTITQWS